MNDGVWPEPRRPAAPVAEAKARAVAPATPAAAPVRLAAIDIGTNSVRLMVADAQGTDDFRLVGDEKITTRLGAGLTVTGQLSPEAIQRTVEAVAHLKAIAEGRGATRLAAVATSATREAPNGAAFLARLRHELGLEVRVISGQEEAELAYLSVQHNFHLPNERIVCLDIGGGSLELVFTAGPVVEEVHSLPLGAVRLTDQLVRSDPVSRRDWKALRRHIRTELERALGDRGLGGTLVIGSGGTVSTLGRVIAHLRGDRLTRAHGYRSNRSHVKHALDLFRALPVESRHEIGGLPADRADIILAGAAAFNQVLRYVGVNNFIVNEHGIREGVILQLTRELWGAPAAAGSADWRESVRAFGAACGAPRANEEHVAGLALSLFDQLGGLHGYGEEERRLVEAAALLRNAGHHVSYERHHVHSYHLIQHANLPGFTPREIELIANLARYHRRALPRRRHPNFARLGRADRERVERLGAIVRLTDGLDRSHRRRVRGIEATVGKRRLHLTLVADQPLDLELWGGAERKDLLERAYGVEVTLDARAPAAGGVEVEAGGCQTAGDLRSS